MGNETNSVSQKPRIASSEIGERVLNKLKEALDKNSPATESTVNVSNVATGDFGTNSTNKGWVV